MFNCEFNCRLMNTNDWTLQNRHLIQHADLNTMLSCGDDSIYDVTQSDSQKCFEFVLPFETGMLNLGRFVSCLEMKLKQLCRYENFNEFTSNSSTYDLNFYNMRSSVREFVIYVYRYFDSINWDHNIIQQFELPKPLSDFHFTIRKYLSRLYRFPDSLLNYAASKSGNSCPHPAYHIYHLHLELRWLYLVLLYSRLKSDHMTGENEELNDTIVLILHDLIYIATRIFVKRNLIGGELKTRTPYLCNCMREMWLMLQILIRDLHDRDHTKTFWDCVNIVLNNLTVQKQELKTSWHQEKPITDVKNTEVFGIWIMYHINLLQGYENDGSYSSFNVGKVDSNHLKLEELLKSYISKVGKDESVEKELCAIIPLLHSLISEWWDSDTRVIKCLLDYFQSRINQQYLLQAFLPGPWSVTFDRKTPSDILNQVRDRVQGTELSKESSFGLFLKLLGQFLYNNNLKKQPKFWNQIKARIFIKFNISRVADLTEDGLFNFLSLFLTLAIYADPDVCLKIMSIPINFSSPSRKYTFIYKVKLAVILFYNETGLDFKDLKLNENKQNFLNEINQISCMKSTVSLMKYYIDVLNVIIMSNPRLDRHVHIFFDGWVDRFMSTCHKDTFVLFVDMVSLIFNYCLQHGSENCAILDSLWKFIPSRIRQMALDPNLCEDSENIAKLAVMFTMEALRNPATAERQRHSAVSLFQHFATSIMIKNTVIIQDYLTQLLLNPAAVEQLKEKIPKFEQYVIQAWIRISIMLGDKENKNLKVIKIFIMNTTEIRQIITSPSQAQLFRSSNTPFIDFLRALMETRKTVQVPSTFDEKWRVYFQKIEKWAFASITKDEESNDKISNDTIQVYKCLGFLFFYCSPIFYVKNQPQNMLKTLLTTAMLPNEDKAYLKNAGKRIFSWVVLGLESLNVQGDFNLLCMLQNLFEQYLPLLITGVSNNLPEVLLNCFTETSDVYLNVIFTKLASFIISPSENMTHKHCYLVMILLTNLAQGHCRYSSKVFELIVSTCVAPVINCYLKVHELHPHKKHTVELFRAVFENPYYMSTAAIANNLASIINSFVHKNITINCQSTFALLNSITPLNVNLVKSMLPKIEQIILECEKFRRPITQSLKYSYEKLKKEIEQHSSYF